MSASLPEALGARARLHRIHWWRVVTDLMQSGMTHAAIGERCDCAKSTITTLRNQGGDPSFGVGVALLALWLERMDSAPEQIPRLPVAMRAGR